jgi:uncharacterized membrane protein YeaQ/YmgE (transglycosylase-associated protein family)
MSLLSTLVIGFVIGIIARIWTHGKNNPKGFIVTALLGVIGSFAATFLGQFFGFYQPGESAGFFGSIVGAIFVLYVWNYFAKRSSPVNEAAKTDSK